MKRNFAGGSYLTSRSTKVQILAESSKKTYTYFDRLKFTKYARKNKVTSKVKFCLPMLEGLKVTDTAPLILASLFSGFTLNYKSLRFFVEVFC